MSEPTQAAACLSFTHGIIAQKRSLPRQSSRRAACHLMQSDTELIIDRQGLPGFMRGDPFLEFGHMAALLGNKFLGKRLDLGIVSRLQNILVIFKTRRLRIE